MTAFLEDSIQIHKQKETACNQSSASLLDFLDGFGKSKQDFSKTTIKFLLR